jgi:hypothetical protein
VNAGAARAVSARIGDAMAFDPVVFISSTSDDLKEYREQAAKAAMASASRRA